jgi:hypothetical protein
MWEMNVKFLLENLKGRDQVGDFGIGRMIILE